MAKTMINRLQINNKAKKQWSLVAGLLLLLFLLVLWLTSKTSIKIFYTEISRGIDSSLLSESGQFNHQALERLSLQLRQEGVDEFNRIIDTNPGFLQQLQQDLSGLVINYPGLDDQTHHQYLLATIDLVFSLHLMAEKPTDLQQFLQKSQDIDALLSLMMRPTEGAWSITKEERIGLAAKLMVLQAVSVEGAALNKRYKTPSGSDHLNPIIERYFQAKHQRSPHRIAERGLLQALWLRSISPDFLSSTDFMDSLSLAFEAIKTESDLIRLLSHENAIVALGAARTVSLLVPENALPAIRYQLVRASSQSAWEQSFALLDALAAYGEQGRIAELQLKKMMVLTQNSELRRKIKHTLDRLYGKSVQSQNAKG